MLKQKVTKLVLTFEYTHFSHSVRSTRKLLLLHIKVWWFFEGKYLYDYFVGGWPSYVFHAIPLLSERMLGRQSMVIQTWVYIFSKINKVSLSLQGKSLMLFGDNDKMQFLKQNPEFWKTSINMNLKAKTFKIFLWDCDLNWSIWALGIL